MARQTKGRMFKRGKTWHLQWYVNGKEYRRSLHKTVKEEAEKEAAKLLAPVKARQSAADLRAIADAKEGEAAKLEDDLRDKLTVADAWTAFEDARNRNQCSPVTMRDYRRRWQRFADWMEERRPDGTMQAVTEEDASAFALSLDKSNLSANRRNKFISTARYVFNTLLKQAGRTANPFGHSSKTGIRAVKQRTTSHRPLSEGELRAVCSAAEGELRILIAVGLFCGLRLKDAALLRWESIDLHGNQSLTLESAKRQKKVPMKLHRVLVAMLAETPPEERAGFVMPEMARLYGKDGSALSRTVRRLFEASGIETQSDVGTCNSRALVSFHSLRASFVTLSARYGTPLAVLRAVVGHGSPAVQAVYLDFNNDDISAAVNALPDVTGPANAPTEAVQRPLSDSELLAAIRARLSADDVPEAVKRDVLAMIDAR